jgi:septal ring factor EnvC (AmiA/AmiB activator)
MLTNRAYKALKDQHGVIKSRKQALQADRKSLKESLDAIDAQILDIEDEEKTYTEGVKPLLREYEDAHGK